MDITRVIFYTLTVQNPLVVALVILVNTSLWNIVDIKMAEQLLGIEVEKKQKIILWIMATIIISICKLILPGLSYKIISLIGFALIMRIVTKTDLAKCLFVQIFDYVVIFVVESFLIKFITDLVGVERYYHILALLPYRIVAGTLMLIVISIVYYIFNTKNVVLNFPDNLDKKRKVTIIVAAIVGIFMITKKFIDIATYSNQLNYILFVIDVTSIIMVFFVSAKYIMNISAVDRKEQEIEKLKNYNENLCELYDDIRGFRHDFGNIIQSLGGYINTGNLCELQRMYNDLVEECEETRELETLTPFIINNDAVYNIINQKYKKAKKQNVKMVLNILADFSKISIKTYEFCKILAILLDNAIEAAKQSEEKLVELTIQKEDKNRRNIVIIRNSYNQQEIDLDKIFDRNYTTKQTEKGRHGLGLWEVRKILNKNDNLNLHTTIEGKLFKQQLEIYLKEENIINTNLLALCPIEKNSKSN